MNCKSCVNYGLYQMVTAGPYGYSGDIPCLRCSHFSTTEDNYVAATVSYSSSNKTQCRTKEEAKKLIEELDNLCVVAVWNCNQGEIIDRLMGKDW